MSIISYNDLLANALEADLFALGVLACSEVIKTTDPVQADEYQAQGLRLFSDGVECLTRFTRGVERSGGQVWHTFEGRVDPVAVSYLAQLAVDRITLSREPLAQG